MVELDLTKTIIFIILSSLTVAGVSFYFKKKLKLSLVIGLNYLLIFVLFASLYSLLKDTFISFTFISLSGILLTSLFFITEAINVIEKGYKNWKFPISFVIIVFILLLLPAYFYPNELLQTLLISFGVYIITITTLHISLKYLK